jgi:hypothetical protein
VDAAGNALAWQQCIVSQPVLRGGRFDSFIPKGSAFDPTSVEGASDMPYTIPNLLVDTHEGNRTVPILWWRSVGHSHTGFTVNCAMDELAALAGADPVEFRRKLLGKDPRFLAVLNKAAEMSGWGSPVPAGRGRGIAIQNSFGSIVAEVAEVSVQGSEVRVHKVWCAIDCGFAANPSGVVAQMESAINYGLSAALHGEISFENGRVQQSNFHDYQVLAHQRGAGDRGGHHQFGRGDGRRRRTRHTADRTGGRERHLRGHGQARAQVADRQESRLSARAARVQVAGVDRRRARGGLRAARGRGALDRAPAGLEICDAERS